MHLIDQKDILKIFERKTYLFFRFTTQEQSQNIQNFNFMHYLKSRNKLLVFFSNSKLTFSV